MCGRGVVACLCVSICLSSCLLECLSSSSLCLFLLATVSSEVRYCDRSLPVPFSLPQSCHFCACYANELFSAFCLVPAYPKTLSCKLLYKKHFFPLHSHKKKLSSDLFLVMIAFKEQVIPNDPYEMKCRHSIWQSFESVVSSSSWWYEAPG